MEFFGELLAELRKDKKLSQKELADIFHLAASTISSYEMGVHSPHVDQLAKFADYFNVSTDYLLGRTSSDLSPQVLEEIFVDNIKVGSVIDILKSLPEDRRRALWLLLKDVHLSNTIRKAK